MLQVSVNQMYCSSLFSLAASFSSLTALYWSLSWKETVAALTAAPAKSEQISESYAFAAYCQILTTTRKSSSAWIRRGGTIFSSNFSLDPFSDAHSLQVLPQQLPDPKSLTLYHLPGALSLHIDIKRSIFYQRYFFSILESPWIS